jgi:hypothetical protein
MPQKSVTQLTAAGIYPLTFSPTSTKFDIYNNSTYDLDITFGKTSGLSDIYLAPQASILQVAPHSVQYSSGAVKWDGRIFIVATVPMGGNAWPGQGVAQQVTIVGYETGYSAQNMLALNNASQPANIVGQVANTMYSNTYTPSSTLSVQLPANGPLGYNFLLGIDVTAGLATASGNTPVQITNCYSSTGTISINYEYSYFTAAPHDLFPRMPGGIRLNSGAASFIVIQSASIPVLSIIIYMNVF